MNKSVEELTFRLQSALNFIEMKLGKTALEQHLYATDKEWQKIKPAIHHGQLA